MADKKKGAEYNDRIWVDKKRILGMPISFTEYSLSDDRLFIKRGLLKTEFEETLLYRIRDISLTRTLGQKMFGVGTITIRSVDPSAPTIYIKNIKDSYETKELIHKMVEGVKNKKGVGVTEFINTGVN